jgi:hypothetical protein
MVKEMSLNNGVALYLFETAWALIIGGNSIILSKARSPAFREAQHFGSRFSASFVFRPCGAQ